MERCTILYIHLSTLLLMCQNLGAASSNPVQTRQDTIDVDCCVREYKKRRESKRRTHFVDLSSLSIGYYWLYIIL